MSVLSFTVRFLGPFAITAGHSSDGIDARVDRQELLPASSLKGLMRAEAEHELGVSSRVVKEIFGSAGKQGESSPWAWSDAVFAQQPIIERLARIKIEGEGRADEGSLLMAEAVWASDASFEIVRVAALSDDAIRRHSLVLRAAARSISSLGAGRRRGFGWVSVVDAGDLEWTSSDTLALKKLIGDGDE